MKYSNGVIMSPITSVRHKPIGELKSNRVYKVIVNIIFFEFVCLISVDYLIIKPTKDINCNLKKIKTTDWKSSYVPLDIGHRGSGSSFNELESE